MKKYVIIEASEVSNIDFNDVLENSIETLVYNLDNTKTFVKYEGTQPFSLLGKTEYNQEEILNILSGPEWTSEEVI
jgi:hypothetical protein